MPSAEELDALGGDAFRGLFLDQFGREGLVMLLIYVKGQAPGAMVEALSYILPMLGEYPALLGRDPFAPPRQTGPAAVIAGLPVPPLGAVPGAPVPPQLREQGLG